MICPICGKEFLPKSHRQKYCSEPCRYEVKKQRRRQRIVTKTCVVCGNEFKTYNDKATHCSACCIARANVQKHQSERKVCPYCGKTFAPKASHQKYCSRRCASSANWRKNHPIEATTKICPICGETFAPKASHQKYCSRNCSVNASNRRREYQAAEPVTKICEHCGGKFVTKYKNKIFCSDKCQRASYKARQKEKTVMLKCHYCHCLFESRGWKKYCSSICKRAGENLESRAENVTVETAAVETAKPVVKVVKSEPPKVIIPAAVAENRKPTTDELLDWIFGSKTVNGEEASA